MIFYTYLGRKIILVYVTIQYSLSLLKLFKCRKKIKKMMWQNNNPFEELDMVLRSPCILCKLQRPLLTAEDFWLP